MNRDGGIGVKSCLLENSMKYPNYKLCAIIVLFSLDKAEAATISRF